MGTVLLIGKNFWESACNDDTVYQDIKGIIRSSTYTHGVLVEPALIGIMASIALLARKLDTLSASHISNRYVYTVIPQTTPSLFKLAEWCLVQYK